MSRLALRRIGVASNASLALPTLGECIELLLGQGDALAQEVLAALKAPLEQAALSRPDKVDPAIDAAVRHMDVQSMAVRATFCAELRRLVYQGGALDPLGPAIGRIEDIHVFDLQVLEAQIEQALAQQEVARAVDDVLPLFHALVSALLGWTSVQPALNPLKPEAFLRALSETLVQWVADEAVRTVLLRPSAIALGISLRQIYRETCEWLRSQGVEPVAAPDLRAARGATPAAGGKSDLNKTVETLDKLRLLLGAEPLGGSEGGLRDFIHTIPASLVALQDLRLVEPMIQRLAERSAQPGHPARQVSAPARTVAGSPRNREQNQRLGRQLAEEVVRMMLEQVVQDERLLGTVRLQLRALEGMLVRLALADPRFFIDRAHPARQLLDRIVQRSLGVDQRDQDGIYGFTACVSNSVGSLLRSPGDASAFLQALDVLERHLFELEETRRKQREFERAEREHGEKRALMAQRFGQALAVRFHDLELPPFVTEFLRGPWSMVLAEAHLRGGGGGDPRGYRAVMDDLVWSVQPHRDPREFARLVRLVPRLLARLNEGLVLIRYARAPLTEFLDALSALHDESLERHRRALAAGRAAAEFRASQQAALAGSDDPPGLPPPAQGVDPRGPGAVERRRRPRKPEPSQAASGAGELQVGYWVDLQLGGRWVRAELSWISPNRSLFMFTSGAGLAHAMSRRTMDRLQAHGRLRLGTAPEPIDLLLDTARGVLSGRDPDAD